jgi:hypothetical protein
VIKDAEGHQLSYWPIPGLVEGEETGVLTILVDTPVAGSRLVATYDARVRLWGRVAGSGDFVDLAQEGLDLSALPAGETAFELYAEAVGPVAGLDRVALSVAAGVNSPAGWLT